MEEKKGFWSKLFSSGANALNPLKLIARVFMFFTFGVLTAFPYLLNNINTIYPKIQGETLIIKLFYWSKALGGATLKGLLIGFSSLWDTIINLSEKLSNHYYGDIGYSLMVLFFGVWAVFQIVSVIFDIADLKSGSHYNKFWAYLVSLVLVIAIISPISHVSLNGQTITSGVTILPILNETEITINTSNINNTNSSIINSLNMLTGD